MKILNEQLSSHEEKLIKEVEESLHKPVHYCYLNNELSNFGAADYFSNPNFYTVYSQKGLHGHNFVNNILHELFHLCQIEEGYPTSSTKNTLITIGEQQYFNSIGTLSASVILDLDVNERLLSVGYDSKYFFDYRYQEALDLFYNHSIVYKDAFENAQLILNLILMRITDTQEHSNHIFELYSSKIPILIKQTDLLAQRIKETGYTAPLKSFECLSYLYDQLNLWSFQKISFDGKVFKISKQAKNFITNEYTHK